MMLKTCGPKFISKLKEAIDLYVPCKKQVAAKYMNKPVPNFIRKLINKKECYGQN